MIWKIVTASLGVLAILIILNLLMNIVSIAPELQIFLGLAMLGLLAYLVIKNRNEAL